MWLGDVYITAVLSVYKNTKSTPLGDVAEDLLGVGEEGVLERPKAGAVRIHEERLPGTGRVGGRPQGAVEEGERLGLGQASAVNELAQALVVGLPASGHVHHRNGRCCLRAQRPLKCSCRLVRRASRLRFVARQPQRRRLEGEARALRLRLRTLEGVGGQLVRQVVPPQPPKLRPRLL
jgi:hypothetical protein